MGRVKEPTFYATQSSRHSCLLRRRDLSFHRDKSDFGGLLRVRCCIYHLNIIDPFNSGLGFGVPLPLHVYSGEVGNFFGTSALAYKWACLCHVFVRSSCSHITEVEVLSRPRRQVGCAVSCIVTRLVILSPTSYSQVNPLAFRSTHMLCLAFSLKLARSIRSA